MKGHKKHLYFLVDFMLLVHVAAAAAAAIRKMSCVASKFHTLRTKSRLTTVVVASVIAKKIMQFCLFSSLQVWPT